MGIKAACPKCRSSFNFPESTRGKQVRCFKCMTSILVPGSPSEEELSGLEEVEAYESGEEIEEVEEVRRLVRRGPRRRRGEPEGLSATTITLIGVGALAALLVVVGGILLWSHLRAIETANQLSAQAQKGPQIAIGPEGIRIQGVEVRPGPGPGIDPVVRPPDPAPPAIKPVQAPADFPEAVRRLQTDQGASRQAALDWLAAQPVDPNQRTAVTQALVALLKDNNPALRNQALKVLEPWASPEVVPALVGLLNDNTFYAKDRVMDLLVQLKDSQGLVAIAACLPRLADRSRASQALKKAGPAAEQAVLPYLNNTDLFTRQAAVDVLAVIGTPASVPALIQLANADRSLKFRAQNAAQQASQRK